MKAFIRNAAMVMAVASTSVVVAACGTGGGNTSDGGNTHRIGLLLPNATTARWETRDGPLLEKRIKELCDDCTVEHANAKGDLAMQQEQMDSVITKGVDAIVLVAVDARSLGATVRKAHAAGIPVIAYDRLAEGPISGYVSFDGEETGSISALRANKVDPLPPVTGQGADLAAVRRIVVGDQYMTVYKPFGPEASAAAMAMTMAHGDSLDRMATGKVRTREGTAVPAVVLTPASVTVADTKNTLVKDGEYTIQQICTPPLRVACHRDGLT